MDQYQRGPTGLLNLNEDSSRRNAVRILGAAGVALLGVLGLRTGAYAKVSADKKTTKKRGPAGPTGPAGPAGPTSVAGLVVNRREGAQLDVPAGTSDAGEVGCQAGEVLLGGGFSAALPAGCAVRAADIDQATGRWLIGITCAVGSSVQNAIPIAFCLAVAS